MIVDDAGGAVESRRKQCVSLKLVLRQYVQLGVDKPSPDKLRLLLRLKSRNSIADAMTELGQPEQIGQLFAEFQKYLCRDDVA